MSTSNTPSPLSQVGPYILLTLTAVVPFFIAPFTNAFASDSKQLLAIVGGLLLMGWWALTAIHAKSLTVRRSPFTALLAAWSVISFLSAVVAQKYFANGFTELTGVYIALSFIAGFGSVAVANGDSTKRANLQYRWLLALLAGAAILSCTTILQFLNIGPSRVINALMGTQFPNNLIFNLAESPLVATQVFLIALFGGLSHVLTNRGNSNNSHWALTLSGIIIPGLALSAWSILPGGIAHQLTPDFGATWSIVLDVFKNIRTALIGVGPDSFATAYTQFKPAWLNGSPAWTLVFAQGANLPLTLLITTGLLGFSTYAGLVFLIIRRLITKSELRKLPSSWVLVGLLVGQMVFPPHVVLLTLFACTLAVWLGTHHEGSKLELSQIISRIGKHTMHDETEFVSSFKPINQILGGAFVIAILVAFYGLGRAYAAKHYLYQSLLAESKNEPVKAYELQKKAKLLNPYNDVIRRNFAQTSLAIATALSNKIDLTDDEREQVLQLIKQAIENARAAVVVEPRDVRNWQTMAQTYKQLIGVADNAEQWTIDSYIGAVRVSPTDPVLRLDMGAVFYQQANYSQAIKIFEQATELKPDYPSAHYSLANAYKMSGELEQAEISYQKLLTLLVPSSDAAVQATQELQQLQETRQKQVAEPTKSAASAPQPSPSPTTTFDTESLNTNQPAPGGLQELLKQDNLNL